MHFKIKFRVVIQSQLWRAGITTRKKIGKTIAEYLPQHTPLQLPHPQGTVC